MPVSNSQPDTYYISEVRRILRDQPVWQTDAFVTDGSSGALTAGNKPFKLQRSPVVTSGIVVTAPGGPYTVVYNTAPAAGQVEVVTDTGEIIFNTAPATGSLLVTYQAFRFSDQQITDALYEGMSLMWPELWRPQRIDNALPISPVIYEYDLPQVFQDPNVQMLKVDYMPPSGIIRFYTTSTWDMVRDIVNPRIAFTRLPPVGSFVRLTFTAPFTALSQTPTVMQHLPVYYACGRLMGDTATMRARSDDLVALKAEGANQPNTSLQVSSYWLDRYDKQLIKLGLTTPIRMTVADRIAEKLGLGSMWRSE